MITFLIVVCGLVVWSIAAWGYYSFAKWDWQECKPWFIFPATWFMYSQIGDGYDGGDDSLGFGKVFCFFFWWLFVTIDLVVIAIVIIPFGFWLFFRIPGIISFNKFQKELAKEQTIPE